MRRFEYSDATSSKFWEIDQQGCDLHVRFGKIGTAGQAQCKTHPDEDRAAAALSKLVKEKTGKGYVETSSDGMHTAPAIAPPKPVKVAPVKPRGADEPAADAPPAPVPEPAVFPSDVPPWAAAGPVIDIPPKLASRALPSLRFPGPRPSDNAEKCWTLFLERARTKVKLDDTYGVTGMQGATVEARARIRDGIREGSRESDLVLFAVDLFCESELTPKLHSPFVSFLVLSRGLPYALDVLIELERKFSVGFLDREQIVLKILPLSHGCILSGEYIFADTELALRAHLAHADSEVRQECIDMIRAALPTLPATRRPLLAALLPDVAALSDELVPEWLDTTVDSTAIWLLPATTMPIPLLERMERSPRWTWANPLYGSLDMCAHILVERGMDAFDILQRGAASAGAGTALGCIGTPEAMTLLARASRADKDSLKRFSVAAQRWPLAAMAALSELIAADPRGWADYLPTLSGLVGAQRAAVPAFVPWVSPKAAELMAKCADRFSAPEDIADPAEVPQVLISQPWTKPATKKHAALKLEPLHIAPVERWTGAERAALLSEINTYARNHYNNPDPMARARAIGFSHPPFDQRATAALDAGDSAALIAIYHDYIKEHYISIETQLIADLPDAINADLFNVFAVSDVYSHSYAVGKLGLRGLPGVVALCHANPASLLPLAAYFGAVDFAPLMARVLATVKARNPRMHARRWLLDNSDYAAAALIAPALGAAAPERDHAATALQFLAENGHEAVLMEVVSRYGDAAVSTALRELLDEDPLGRIPPKASAKLPGWWHPLGWPRPLLASNGKALPDSVLDALGIMMRFPSETHVYPGIVHVKEACTSASLAEFAWAAFEAWRSAGADAKENWAFTALGLFGNDDTARRLTPLIRIWPGEAQHARAVAGLDILGRIGSDTALMLLNGIAQKVKFKGLQDRARDKISDIAEARGLTTDELEDRLAPDLGLDDHGSLLLDFGPRRFRVSFNEALKPFVCDSEGAQLGDLPKPKKTDDAALSAVAVERFKLLKKDARTIASQQVLRLEVAMCTQRRWTPEVFNVFLARHPLLRHLVQRLVWGVYRVEHEASYGGELLACFRATPEGDLTTADDDSFTLPQGDDIRIGLPHALDMPAPDAAAFGQLFADYELLQPFIQIGRDTYALDDAERAGEQLLRWKDSKVATGRVLGLVNKGWRRGPTADAGVIQCMHKDLGNGNVIELQLDPGIIAGVVDEFPDQLLQEVVMGQPGGWAGINSRIPFTGLAPIAASEMIRDLEVLRA